MNANEVLKTIHERCDVVLAKCDLQPMRDEVRDPFAVVAYYGKVHSPRFQVQIFAEDDLVTRSTSFGISIIDTDAGAETYPRSVVESVFDDDSYVRDYGIASAEIIYDIYGCRLFSEETLADPRIPWFKPPRPIPV